MEESQMIKGEKEWSSSTEAQRHGADTLRCTVSLMFATLGAVNSEDVTALQIAADQVGSLVRLEVRRRCREGGLEPTKEEIAFLLLLDHKAAPKYIEALNDREEWYETWPVETDAQLLPVRVFQSAIRLMLESLGGATVENGEIVMWIVSDEIDYLLSFSVAGQDLTLEAEADARPVC